VVSYTNVGIPLGIPNKVQLIITYLNTTDTPKTIFKAELIAYFWSSPNEDNSTELEIQLVPMSLIQRFIVGGG
jgi:hypothetical protein